MQKIKRCLHVSKPWISFHCTSLGSMTYFIVVMVSTCLLYNSTNAQDNINLNDKNLKAEILPGAALMDKYLPLIKGKSVAIFANQTSVVGNTHLVDTLLSKGIRIKKIFSPEHGFRGTADAGEEVGNS